MWYEHIGNDCYEHAVIERGLGGDDPEPMATIYALVDPRDNAIRYVGKIIGRLSQRINAHLRNTKLTPLTAWLDALRDSGLHPDVRQPARVPRHDSCRVEMYAIYAHHDAGCTLLNAYSNVRLPPAFRRWQ